MSPVVIVGAGHGGVQLAASLRDGGFDGEIVLVDAQEQLPYQRPPLSKQYLTGEISDDDLLLRPPNFFASRDIDLRLGTRVTGIARSRRMVQLHDGMEIPYNQLILAQGATSRKLSAPGAELDGVCVLETSEQAGHLRKRIDTAKHIVVIGGGFIGMEVAAAASQSSEVTVLERQGRVLARAVSSPVSRVVEATHRNAGNAVLTGTSISELRGANGHVTEVVLDDGNAIPADLVIAGLGAVPHIEVAAQAELHIANGIVIDDYLRTSDPAIFAIGDCAARIDQLDGSTKRLECIQNSVDQARHVADQILHGRGDPYTAIPYFWTTQFTLKIQTVGVGRPDDDLVVLGDPDAASFSVCRFNNGQLMAVESVNRPRDHMAARKLLNGTVAVTPEAAAESGFDLKAHLLGQSVPMTLGIA